MNVYTVAGSLTATALGDGGPAVNAKIDATEGIWIDGNCNLYISDMGYARIRRVNLNTGVITTIAGNGTGGFSGDNGPATDAQIKHPYGLYADSIGNVYFVDQFNDRIRRVDAATGIITTIAGGGSSTGDGGPATNAQIIFSQGVYGDKFGNIYFGDNARIRKVDVAGIITTIAGTGVVGLSGDNGPATNACVSLSPAGMQFDANGDLLFADRGNSRIRKIEITTGIITTIAGSIPGFSGDGGLATNAQLGGPISISLDIYGNLIIGDNGNNRMRIVNAATGFITTFAGVGTAVIGDKTEGAPAISADMHPEFLYLDRGGNLYYSNYSKQVRKITGLNPGLAASGSLCNPNSIPPENVINSKVEIYPNPVTTELTINLNSHTYTTLSITNSIGQVVLNRDIISATEKLNLEWLPPGVYFILLKGATRQGQLHFVKM